MLKRAAFLGLMFVSTGARAQAPTSAEPPLPAATGAAAAPSEASASSATAPTDAPTAPGDATTAPADASTAQARDAFRLGSTLARQGQWLDALAAFERSAELYPHPVTTYNMGYVERALGHLTRARKYMQQALQPGSTGQTLPEDLTALARGYMAEIDRKLARIVVLAGSPDVAIAIDGRPLEVTPGATGERPLWVAGTLPPGPVQRAPATTFDVLIDPGSHVILVSAPGKPDAVLTRVFAQGSTDTLRLPEAETREAPAPAPPSKPEPMADQAESEGTHLTPWMWTAFGVGAVGIVTGTVFGALALDENSTLDAECKPTRRDCPSGYGDNIERLDVYAPVADIAFIVGAVGIGTGGVLWFLDNEGSSEEGATLRVQGGGGAARVSLSGRF